MRELERAVSAVVPKTSWGSTQYIRATLGGLKFDHLKPYQPVDCLLKDGYVLQQTSDIITYEGSDHINFMTEEAPFLVTFNKLEAPGSGEFKCIANYAHSKNKEGDIKEKKVTLLRGDYSGPDGLEEACFGAVLNSKKFINRCKKRLKNVIKAVRYDCKEFNEEVPLEECMTEEKIAWEREDALNYNQGIKASLYRGNDETGVNVTIATKDLTCEDFLD